MATFENQERRMDGIRECLKKYGIASLDEAREICLSNGIDVEKSCWAFSRSLSRTPFGRIR